MLKRLKQILAKIILKANQHYVDEFYRACIDCETTQNTCLENIVSNWIQHPLLTQLNIKTIDKYKKHMPIQSYESLMPYLEEKRLYSKNTLLAYLKTSGSNSKPKYIPFTKSCKQILKESWTIWGWFYFNHNFEDIEAKILRVENHAKSTNSEIHNHKPVKTMNTIIESLQKYYVKWRYTKKLNGETIILFAANPYTLLKYLETQNPTLQRITSNIIKVVTWKHGSMSRYLVELEKNFPQTRIYDPGYQASEGFFAIPIHPKEPGGVLNIQRYFFEFLEVCKDTTTVTEKDNKLLQSHQLECGRQYLVFISTHSGLFRYPMNDIIECVGFYGNTPKVIFMQKSNEFINVCGEKISSIQLDRCIEELGKVTNISVENIRIVAVPYLNQRTPQYIALFFMDNTSQAKSLLHQNEALAQVMDDSLRNSNCEYLQKRDSQRIQNPTIKTLPTSSAFAKFFQIFQNHHAQYKPKAFLELKEIDDLFLKELNLN